ncbi:hypothetical protein GCM10007304_44660 [Rhodococcoides trifolii]|uniref:Uncharacterized protein n=1 Tax=Rhodococcoides trifolii TaxID=908250 RepID=A0A917G7K6_9NOCA|nr:hypothetical protein [Rhodococcus trifolii]GGG25894.1 hypothetical protein GCM10007304_44660 [Rhodococcus trifolii]
MDKRSPFARTLVWQLPTSGAVDVPHTDVAARPPEVWIEALAAVSRDLRCRKYGGPVVNDRLRWQLTFDTDYLVTVGLLDIDTALGWAHRGRLAVDASYATAVAWIASTVQSHLSRIDHVDWPAHGGRTLVLTTVAGLGVWQDHYGEHGIEIGNLCRQGGESEVCSC